jgi:hypothetical protein
MRFIPALILLGLLSCKKEVASSPDVDKSNEAESSTNISGALTTKNKYGYVFVDTTLKFEIKLNGPVNYSTTRASGNFQFTNIPHGTYWLEVSRQGYGAFRSGPIVTVDSEWQYVQRITVYEKPTYELSSFKMKDSIINEHQFCINLISSFDSGPGDKNSIVLFGLRRDINLADTSSFIDYNSVTSYNNELSGRTVTYWGRNIPSGLKSGTYVYAVSVSCSGFYRAPGSDKPINLVTGSVILRDSVLVP